MEVGGHEEDILNLVDAQEDDETYNLEVPAISQRGD